MLVFIVKCWVIGGLLMELYFSGDAGTNRFHASVHIRGKSLEPLPPGHVFGPTTGSSFLMQYCLEGRGVMEVDGNRFPMKKGDCIVTFPGQTRYERADSREPWAFLWISLTGDSAGQFFHRMGLTPLSPVLPDCGRTRIPVLMEQLVETAGAEDLQNDFLLGSRLFAFFDACLKLRQERERSADTGAGYTEKALAYLHANYTRQALTVAELARYLGLNRSYFYELFKGQTGLSPQEYLTRLRIRKSCELLQQPQVTAADAAYSVGYEPSVFSKAFKRTMGMTPGQYKRSYK